MPQYARLRRDFERLESVDECDEWGWAEESFLNLLQHPTKAKASGIYESLIRQWLSEHEPTAETEWAYKKYD